MRFSGLYYDARLCIFFFFSVAAASAVQRTSRRQGRLVLGTRTARSVHVVGCAAVVCHYFWRLAKRFCFKLRSQISFTDEGYQTAVCLERRSGCLPADGMNDKCRALAVPQARFRNLSLRENVKVVPEGRSRRCLEKCNG